jgi:prepilin-type processing-associated H-X9-DG protein
MEPRDLVMPAIREPDREKYTAALGATDQVLLNQGLADREHHSKGVNFFFADQHVEPFQIDDGALLRSMFTIDGYEVFCAEEL